MLDVRTSQPAVEKRINLGALSRSDVIVGVLLTLVMLLGGYFRFVGQNWDDFTHLHPDERFLTGVASGIGGLNPSLAGTAAEEQLNRCQARYPNSGGVGGFFDAECSVWNPHNTGPTNGMYVYGTLPLFLARGAGDLMNQLTGYPASSSLNWAGYNGVHLVWRALSALAEMSAILIVFLLGLTLHDKWVGLVAGALYAAVVLSIQLAHFGTVDAMANFFTVLTIYFAARVQMGGGLGSYAGFGLAFAAALANRINLLPLVGLVLLAAMVRAMPLLVLKLPWRERERHGFEALLGLAVAGVFTLVAFRILNPYTFMGPTFFGLSLNPRWTEDLARARNLVSGAAEMPPNWQWVGRAGYLFPLSNLILWGMGPALGLAAWLAWVWAGVRLLAGKPQALRNLLPVAWVLVYFGWLGSNWVSTMRYFLPIYPALALLAGWLLVMLVRRAARVPLRRALASALLAAVVLFTFLWAAMFTNIYRSQLTRVQASHWVWENISGDFSMQVDGAAPGVPLINIGLANGFGGDTDNPLVGQASFLYDGQVYNQTFTAPASGTISAVYAPHLGDPSLDPEVESLRVLLKNEAGLSVLGQGTLEVDLTTARHPLGDAYSINFDAPVSVEAGKNYVFSVELFSGGPVITGGSVVSHEGAWDDAVPYSVCTLPAGVTLADNPPPGLLNASNCNGRNAWGSLIVGYEMQLAYEDEQYKRDLMLQALDESDYLTISSNRFYDSLLRIPIRWPMSLRYYEALFAGELGYELTATFQETFEFGPLRVSDQYLPTYSSPRWLNEFEAEEAFHVYDHPVVFIFRKTDAYDPQKVRDILNSVPMNRMSAVGGGPVASCPEMFSLPGGGGCDTAVVDTAPISSLQGDAMSTQLMLTPERRAAQVSGGTWSERFDSSDPVNTQPIVTVAAWWLVIMIFGWVVWPLLFLLFPSFGERGYSIAKLVGILVVGWLGWVASSVGLALWSRAGLALIMALFALASLAAALRCRRELAAYVRQHLRRLVVIEIITFAAFAGFLFVRLTNPDLWHQAFGGEKPMDFAYFNAVLRSTIFPAYDPWFAGGFINYYYFGFIIAGTPTLLLGVMPSIAYNLILPTLFALTGIGAFAVAFNVVHHWQMRKVNEADETGAESRFARLGNPWTAGIVALLLAVVLGNLDTPRVFGTGVAQLGGYQTPTGIQDYLIEQYQLQYGMLPTEAALLDIGQRVANNNLADRISYEIHNSTSLVGSLVQGVGRMFSGEPLPIAPNRWYWGPTRVLGETPGVEGNAITEIPFFTFLYGDLHAHMIAMPLLLLIMAFVLNELLLAGRDSRSGRARWLALALGALAVGLLRATNTWDWPTFLILSVVGLGYGWWLTWKGIHRRSLLHLLLRVGGFVTLSFAFALPYITWYAATYGRILPWTEGKTPLWAYFDLHGTFLFLIFSLLVWETARWLTSVYVGALRGTWPLLVSLFVAALGVLLGLALLAAAGFQVVLIVGPLLIWIAILFFRPGQAREMQFVLVMAGLALALTLGVEFIVLDGDIGRQNTVFKFYIQAWMLLSVAGGAAFAWLFQSSAYWSNRLRSIWYVLAALLFGVAALYPVMASRGKALDRIAPETPFTLDGMEYMKYATHFENDAVIPLIDDYNMIRWLQENVKGSPTVIEAQSWREYLWSGRVAIYTGLPSVLGWRFHQTQQRTFDPLPSFVNQRRANINGFYATNSIDEAWKIIRAFDIRYVIVAGLERAYFPPESLAKFDEMTRRGLLERVYQQGEAAVYAVIPGASLMEVRAMTQ